MRILMLLENDFTNDRRVEKEIRTLTNEGHEVVLAAITNEPNYVNEQRGKCNIYRKPISNLIRKSFVTALVLPVYFNYWRKYVNEILLREKPFDVVHVHDLPLAKIGIELKKKLDIRLVIDLHENFPALMEITRNALPMIGKLLVSVKLWQKYEIECLKKADGIIAVVLEMKQRIINNGIAAGNIFILENTSVTPDSFPPYNNMISGKLRLIYIGGITYHRGLQVVIEGLSLIEKKDDLELKIVGDGSYLNKIKELCALNSLTSGIAFTGNLNRKDSEEHLLQSDMALIPHLRSEQADNSSPNKLFEYMAAGIPVLASDCTSVKRVIDETGCGITYKYNSPEDFASKIKSVLREKQLLKQFSENGIKAVKQKYNWNFLSESLLDLYSGIKK